MKALIMTINSRVTMMNTTMTNTTIKVLLASMSTAIDGETMILRLSAISL